VLQKYLEQEKEKEKTKTFQRRSCGLRIEKETIFINIGKYLNLMSFNPD